MLTPVWYNSFKKNRKLMKKRGRDTGKLDAVMRLIASEKPLPAHCRPHALHGDWDGFTECHVENDWIVIYKINAAHTEVVFHSTGAHSDLFKK